jgi:GATA-binding protein
LTPVFTKRAENVWSGTIAGAWGTFDALPHAFGCVVDRLKTRPFILDYINFRFPRRPVDWPHASSTNGALISHLSNNVIGAGEEYTTKLDVSAADLVALMAMSRYNFPLTWKDDCAGEELEGSIWRLYSKTKKELPSHERMENLTWRMMGMSLLKRRQEEAARHVRNKTRL